MSETEEQRRARLAAQKEIEARRAKDKRKREAKNTESLKSIADSADRLARVAMIHADLTEDNFMRSAELIDEYDSYDHLSRDEFYLLLGAIETVEYKLSTAKAQIARTYNEEGHAEYYCLNSVEWLHED